MEIDIGKELIHCFDGSGISFHFIAPAHPAGGSKSRSFGHTHDFKSEIAIHRCPSFPTLPNESLSTNEPFHDRPSLGHDHTSLFGAGFIVTHRPLGPLLHILGRKDSKWHRV